MPDDIKNEDDKPVSPFLADGDKKQGETAAEREEHPDPAQPAANDEQATPMHTDPFAPASTEAQDAPVSAAPLINAEETELAPTYGDRPNPVATEGTTEVSDEPEVGYQFADPNDPIRQRYVEMERQKDEQIAELVKQGDGRPKI